MFYHARLVHERGIKPKNLIVNTTCDKNVECTPVFSILLKIQELWGTLGQNYSDNIRQAVLMRFGKTDTALPEDECLGILRISIGMAAFVLLFSVDLI